MKLEQIDVYSLTEVSNLSAIRCNDFAEAAAVCLDNQGHQSGKILLVEGDLKASFALIWSRVTQQLKNSRNDLNDAVEAGAYCIAMLVVERLTNLRVTKQS